MLLLNAARDSPVDSGASLSTIKWTLGYAVRARAWFRKFREIVLMCAVYNIKRAVKPNAFWRFTSA